MITPILIVVICLGIVFDYTNGFHDAANSIATIVSTKVLTPFQAVLWAAAFNFLVFFFVKEHKVANTVAKIVQEHYVTMNVILAGLVAAITWNLMVRRPLQFFAHAYRWFCRGRYHKRPVHGRRRLKRGKPPLHFNHSCLYCTGAFYWFSIRLYSYHYNFTHL
jgi:hypothetical protein